MPEMAYCESTHISVKCSNSRKNIIDIKPSAGKHKIVKHSTITGRSNESDAEKEIDFSSIENKIFEGTGYLPKSSSSSKLSTGVQSKQEKDSSRRLSTRVQSKQEKDSCRKLSTGVQSKQLKVSCTKLSTEVQSNEGKDSSRKLSTGVQSKQEKDSSRKLSTGVQSKQEKDSSRKLSTVVQSEQGKDLCKKLSPGVQSKQVDSSRKLSTGVQSKQGKDSYRKLSTGVQSKQLKVSCRKLSCRNLKPNDKCQLEINKHQHHSSIIKNNKKSTGSSKCYQNSSNGRGSNINSEIPPISESKGNKRGRNLSGKNVLTSKNDIPNKSKIAPLSRLSREKAKSNERKSAQKPAGKKLESRQSSDSEAGDWEEVESGNAMDDIADLMVKDEAAALDLLSQSTSSKASRNASTLHKNDPDDAAPESMVQITLDAPQLWGDKRRNHKKTKEDRVIIYQNSNNFIHLY